jgi:hypothetical protein
VAVEIHQINGTSSDVSFDLALTGLALPDNQGPVVSAGADLNVTAGTPAALQGSVLDDGLPTPGSLTIGWSKLSGPGTVTFGNPASAVTTAQFTAPGVYVLRLAANDGALSAQDDATVTVAGDSFSAWQARNFTTAELGDPAVSGAGADPDRDGHTNQQEFDAGTDPRDATSVLKAEVLDWDPNAGLPLIVQFQAMPGKSYTVQCQDYAGAFWIKLGDVSPKPSAQTVQVKDFGASRFGLRFYRIVTPHEP